MPWKCQASGYDRLASIGIPGGEQERHCVAADGALRDASHTFDDLGFAIDASASWGWRRLDPVNSQSAYRLAKHHLGVSIAELIGAV